MLLIECFHPVLSLVEDLQGNAPEPRGAGDLERRLIDAFEQSEAEAKDAGHGVLKTDAAKFAFTILIDELLMSEEGPIGGDWKGHLLQEKFFGTRTGGDWMFAEMQKVLEPLPENFDIQLVYLSCLDTGLVAALHKDLASIDEVKHGLRESVHLLRRAGSNDRVLCPTAYRGLGQRGTVNRARRRGGLFTANLVGALVVFAFFIYYSSSITQVVESTATHGVLQTGPIDESTNGSAQNGFGVWVDGASAWIGGVFSRE